MIKIPGFQCFYFLVRERVVELWWRRTWTESFFGGVTTAHGINQTFKEFNGPVRRIFWLFAFAAGIWALVFLGSDACQEFISAVTSTSISTDTHNGLLPMITVCNLSKSLTAPFPARADSADPPLAGPIRCACEAWYDPRITSNATLIKTVLPYLCQDVISFVDTSAWQTLDTNGNALSYTILEQAASFIDLNGIAGRMSQFSGQINCDNGHYTKDAIVRKVLEGTLTYVDAFAYAGYAQRTKLLRGCEVVDSTGGSVTLGQKVACMDDTWWGNVTYDIDYGACHTFNPCHGFPVGGVCDTDADCQHYSDKTLSGGRCDRGLCACNRCMAGSKCRLATQLHAGNGRGVRFLANVGSDQDPLLASPSNGRWNYGLLIDVHTQLSKGDVSEGTTISPGTAAQISLGRTGFTSVHYPFTNCSTSVNVDAKVCQANCLHRAQAMSCCGVSNLSDVRHGRLAPVSAADPNGAPVTLGDPRLLCGLLNESVQACFAQHVEQMASGTLCLDGALGFTTPYYGGLWQRRNWYDSQDVQDESAVGWQEQASLGIRRHCVWTDSQGSGLEERYGRACASADDCASSIGSETGKCVPAYRAYCPQRCDYYDYRVAMVTAEAMTQSTVAIIAADEIALATAQYKIKPNAARRWKPKCGLVPDGTACLTTADANTLVQRNYALVDVAFATFDATVTEEVEGISISTLTGTIGGNLGMFVGMSVMTVLEWLELFLFALLAIPFFLCGVRGLPYIRRADDSDEAADGDEPSMEALKPAALTEAKVVHTCAWACLYVAYLFV
jgi:hypothetical protein